MKIRFRNVRRIGFICVIMAFLATIDVKAEVTIDLKHPDRILIGPNKVYDWVEVNCLSHIILKKVVDYYCDPGPIQKVVYDPLEKCWFITKKHSIWVLLIDGGPESAYLGLINRDRGG